MALFTVENILSAFLIFVRVSGMIMTAPFFSSKTFPVQIKLFFAVVTTFLLFSVIPSENVLTSTADSGFLFIGIAIILELLVGVALGLVGQLIFAGLEMAGSLISLKIGLGFANIVDSMTKQQSTIVSSLFGMLAVLVFLSIDGDKVYIKSLVKSFEVIPVNQAKIELAGPFMLEIATYLFIIGVQITAPFILVLFLLDLSFAIFARIMPQANIMFIALPVKLGIGILLLILVIPYLPVAFEVMFQRMFDFLDRLIVLISG
ncbi:MAG TPA: flagellar biosynthetic protein FliR [Halalkalibaculum sp.]|nr:flagellar biosynthetic protein FliR [Halalkalibaculum sp.]